MMFEPAAIEAIGHYVYALFDPRASERSLSQIFYVGKGSGNRCFAHANEELSKLEIGESELKLRKIKEIRESTGDPPGISIVAHSLSETDAFSLEATLIGSLDGLMNIAGGHHQRDYWLEPAHVNARYSEPIYTHALDDLAVLVSLNGGGPDGLLSYERIATDQEALAARVKGQWPVSKEKARKVGIIVGVYRGLMRVAYRTRKDMSGNAMHRFIKPSSTGRHRCIWEADQDADLTAQFSMKMLVNTDGEILSRMPPGGSFRYAIPEPKLN